MHTLGHTPLSHSQQVDIGSSGKQSEPSNVCSESQGWAPLEPFLQENPGRLYQVLEQLKRQKVTKGR